MTCFQSYAEFVEKDSQLKNLNCAHCQLESMLHVVGTIYGMMSINYSSAPLKFHFTNFLRNAKIGTRNSFLQPVLFICKLEFANALCQSWNPSKYERFFLLNPLIKLLLSNFYCKCKIWIMYLFLLQGTSSHFIVIT